MFIAIKPPAKRRKDMRKLGGELRVPSAMIAGEDIQYSVTPHRKYTTTEGHGRALRAEDRQKLLPFLRQRGLKFDEEKRIVHSDGSPLSRGETGPSRDALRAWSARFKPRRR